MKKIENRKQNKTKQKCQIRFSSMKNGLAGSRKKAKKQTKQPPPTLNHQERIKKAKKEFQFSSTDQKIENFFQEEKKNSEKIIPKKDSCFQFCFFRLN